MAHGKIDGDDVTILVEQSSTPRYVKDGVATPQGRYTLPLFTTEQVYPERQMNKSGDVTLALTPAVLGGWTPESGSTVTDNALIAPVSGQAYVNINLKLETYKALTSVQIRVNGVTVHQDSTTGSTLSIKRVLYLHAGDAVSIVTWWAKNGSVWIWEPSQYSKVLAAGSYVSFEDFPDQSIDFQEDMVYGSDKGFWSDSWGQYVTPTYLKQGMPFATSISLRATATSSSATTTSILARGSVSGPILAQSRIPIPVVPGSKVNFSGQFRVRRTGTNEQTESGVDTPVSVRFALWGIGIQVDEYGVESLIPEELMMQMFQLQPAGSEDESMMEFTLVNLPTPATVQRGMEGMYFTVSLVHDLDSSYGAGTFTSKVSQASGENKPPKTTSEMRYFGWSTANPLKITVDLPPEVEKVTEHPTSLTGVAFKNRKFFEGLDGEAELIFFGMPGQSTTINVYNYTTERGSLIGTYTASPGERKVVTINAETPKIEIDSSSAYFIESVLNNEVRELYRVKTSISDTSYVDCNADAAKISIIHEEADSGSATIDFISKDLDPAINGLLRSGKKVRILARHYGEGKKERPSNWTGEALWEEIYEGTIKKTLTTYGYDDEPISQVTAYNVGDKLDRTPAGAAFDKFEKYGGFLTCLGAKVICNGRSWVGPVSAVPNKYLLNPAAHGDFSLLEAFIMTRNTNKEYFYVNAKNEIVITGEIEPANVRFSDVLGDGDLGYGKLNRKADTETIINQVVTSERLLDAENYRDRDLGSDRPPEDLRYPDTKSQNGTFVNIDSANEIGIMSKTFNVVRTFDGLKALYQGKSGPGFNDWAEDILESHQDSSIMFRDANVPIKDSNDIYWISRIGLMKSVTFAHKGDDVTLVVREIEHTIQPGRWTTKVGFESKDQRTFW